MLTPFRRAGYFGQIYFDNRRWDYDHGGGAHGVNLPVLCLKLQLPLLTLVYENRTDYFAGNYYCPQTNVGLAR